MTDQTTRGHRYLKMHDSGMTLREIGESEGISRERVRQIILEDTGGPVGKRAARKKAEFLIMSSQGDRESIAKSTGVSYQGVCYYVRTADIQVEKSSKSVLAEKLFKLAFDGITGSEAAKCLGISQPTVSAYKKKYGIKFKDGRKRD